MAAVCYAWFGYRALLPIAYPLEIDDIYLDGPITIEEFALTDHSDKTFNREHLHDIWSFLYFNYRQFPNSWPMTLVQLVQAEKLLSD